MDFKKYQSKIFNIIFFGLVVFVIFQKLPTIYSNFKIQNEKPVPVSVERLSGELISFPVIGQKKLVVFWMVNCPPCNLELKRINELVGTGVINAEQVIAVNFVDPKPEVIRYVQDNSLQFLVALDEGGKIADKFNVNVTPTVFLFDELGQVNWATSGLSPSLEFRIKNFFAKK